MLTDFENGSKSRSKIVCGRKINQALKYSDQLNRNLLFDFLKIQLCGSFLFEIGASHQFWENKFEHKIILTWPFGIKAPSVIPSC